MTPGQKSALKQVWVEVLLPALVIMVFAVAAYVHGYRVGKESAPVCPECPEAINLCTHSPLGPSTSCEIHAYPEQGRYLPAGPYIPMRCCLENECMVSHDDLYCVDWDTNARGWSDW